MWKAVFLPSYLGAGVEVVKENFKKNAVIGILEYKKGY